MTLSLVSNMRSAFGRKPKTAPIASTPPPQAAAPLSSYQRNVWEHKQMKDDGLSTIFNLPDMPRLLDILSLNRNAQAPGLQHLLDIHLAGENFEEDEYGNRFLTVPLPDGGEPLIAYTAHCDTMSDDRHSLRHPLRYNAEKDVLFRNDGNVLGADDGTGIWLMLGMIDAKVPGLYAFYLDEETGREGSEWSWANEPERYDNIDIIISFDRKGTGDIIATQRGTKCCSLTFQSALAEALSSETLGLKYTTGAAGSFTDSATFMDEVPECTNISVGYDKQHTSQETQLVDHVQKLRTTLRVVGHAFHDLLPVRRDPTEVPAPTGWAGYGAQSRYPYGGYPPVERPTAWADDIPDAFDDEPFDEEAEAFDLYFSSEEARALEGGDLYELVALFPSEITALLEDCTYEGDEIADYILASNGFSNKENMRNAGTDEKD